MLLYPLEENVDKYKKRNVELQKAMNECKETEDMTFEEFLQNIAKMDFDGVNVRVLRIMLLKNGKEVSSLSWINVLSFIHKILIFYLLNPNRHLGI